MHFWKADPLYRRIFAEVDALWAELRPPDRPLLLRVEERGTPVCGGDLASGRVRNAWIHDDFGTRLAAALRSEPHEFGRIRGEYNEFGLVQFHVARDRAEVDLLYRLGPGIGGALHYDVEGDGEDLRLLTHSGTIS